MEIILGRAAVGIRVGAPVRARVEARSAGRPLVVDLRLRRIRGWAVGVMSVRFAASPATPGYLETEPIGDVPVLIDRRLLPILRRGAAIVERSTWLGDRFQIALDQPEDWLDFLDGRLEIAS